MIQKLEKYADNLENIVQQRTAELYEEKQKTDMLLNRMLPPYVSLPVKPSSHYLLSTAKVITVYAGPRMDKW